MSHIAYCWRSGEIEIGTKCPEACLPLGKGTPEQLEEALSCVARLAYDNKTWLVPGLPEAETDDAAEIAVYDFIAELELRLGA